MNGKLFWATGKPGDPDVLANLVCNLPQVNRKADGCINSFDGDPAKDTWAKRRAFADAMDSEMNPGPPREDFLGGFHD